jgi:N-acetylglucosaminyldiphosphoundecaprenol N-acetyl-beta-D-mannosaminyltransferase
MAIEQKRIHFGRAVVDVVTKEDVLLSARAFFRGVRSSPALIVPVNAQLVHLAMKQPRFAAFLERADLCVADGFPLVAASRLMETPLAERIAGVDLAVDLCRLLAQEGGSVYLLGGRIGAAESTAALLQRRFPSLRIVGADCPPFNFETVLWSAESTLEKIHAARPDLLLVGLGAPKQEYWIEDSVAELPCKVVMGVGGTFDILSGQVPRAPLWMQLCGLEWFFRLCVEPRRLWRRYVVGNSYFLWVVLVQAVGQLFVVNRKLKAKAVR